MATIKYYQDVELREGAEITSLRVDNQSSNPVSANAGQMVWNTTDTELNVYDGSTWQTLVFAAGSSFLTDIVAGGAITVSGTGATRTVAHEDTSTVTLTNSLTGATVVSQLDVDTYGHVTTLSTRTLTLANLGYTGATDADNYVSWTVGDGATTDPVTSGATVNIEGVNGISTSLTGSGPFTVTIDGSGVVGTTYSASTGLNLTGTTFSLSFLGLETLVDPNADRIAFWDDSAGSFEWLTLGTNLSITGTTINATDTNTTYTAGTGLTLGGTTFALTGQALALHNLGTNGIIVRTGAGTVASRTITAGAGVSVTNGDGVAGNPTIAVDTSNAAFDKFTEIAGDSGSATADNSTDTLTFRGGDGIGTTVTDTLSDAIVSIDVDSTVVRTGGNQSIAGNKTFSGTTTFTGDIVQTGARVMTSPETVQIEDNLAVLNFNFTGSPVDDSGYIIERGTSANVGWIWDESADEWALIGTTDDGSGTGNITISNYEALRLSTLFMEDVNAAGTDTDAFLVLDGTEVKTRTGTQLRSDIGAGTVTSVGITAGNGIDVSGGPITTSGSITVSAEISSTTNQGVVELATNSEAQTMTDTARAVTPANLGALRATANLGNGSLSTFTINHNFGSTDVMVQIFEVSTGETIFADVTRTDANNVTVTFGFVPASNQFRALLIMI